MNASSHLRIVDPSDAPLAKTAVEMAGFHTWIGQAHILRDVNAKLEANRINGIIGPSGGGKSTLLRSINRMNDDTDGLANKGRILIDGRDVLAKDEDVIRLRTEVGMVFQKPCVFPKSIAENVLFGVSHQRKLSKTEKADIVETNLKAVSLWKEVEHRLDAQASSLSLGQQQRLCIARSLAVNPRILLLDEPTSSLDPVSSRSIEDLMTSLKGNYTIILVTHNIQQARRIADKLIFICDGKIIEQGSKTQLFQNPTHEQTKKYLQEEFCDC